jgi:predicted ester cyclase
VTAEPDRNKATVRRLVGEVINGGQLDVIAGLYVPAAAVRAREWIVTFRASFPDVQMEIIELIAEGGTVVGHFTCTATHTGTWLGHPPTGRRFDRIDEIGIYRLRNGKITHAWSLEDNLTRLQQLGLIQPTPPAGHHDRQPSSATRARHGRARDHQPRSAARAGGQEDDCGVVRLPRS